MYVYSCAPVAGSVAKAFWKVIRTVWTIQSTLKKSEILYLKKALILFQMTAEENAGRLRAFTNGLLWDRKGNKSMQYIAFYREKSQNKQAI